MMELRPLYNLEALVKAKGPVFITETEPEAMQIYEAGADAVALGSWANAEDLAATVKRIRPRFPLILATWTGDGDTAEAMRQTAELAGNLESAGAAVAYGADTARILKTEDLAGDLAGELRAAVKVDRERAEAAKTPGPDIISGAEFMQNGFDGAINYFRQYKNRKTGFEDIDKYLTLYPGLAVLTGASSLGKTSFAVQLADQLADAGETVLYFTLEQLPLELITKTLARKLAAGATDLNIKNTDIKNGASCPALEKIRAEYAETTGRRVHYCKGTFETTADDIIETVRRFETRYDARPVVIIDYLQLLAAPDNPAGRRLDDRARIDDAVKKLKRLAVDDELFILAISSMARNTYFERIGMDSFKESGMIEYTADYLFGLQLAILEDDEFYTKAGARGGEKETLKAEKQRQVDEANSATPRQLVFKGLKNRNGRKDFKAYFIYDPRYDSFWKDPSKEKDNGWTVLAKT